eukprot:jgi/Antlo1/134/1163
MNTDSKEDKILEITERRKSALDMSKNVEAYCKVIEFISENLEAIAAIDKEALHLEANLYHYDYVDGFRENFRDMKSKELSELLELLRSLNEAKAYFSNDYALNSKYIAETSKLARLVNIQICKRLLGIANQTGEAFVMRKDVQQALGAVDYDVLEYTRRKYFEWRKDEVRKKLSHCRVVSDEIMMALIEHEKILFSMVFDAESGREFVRSIVFDYFSRFDRSQIAEKLNKYKSHKDKEVRWFVDFLEAYAGDQCKDLCHGFQDVHDI